MKLDVVNPETVRTLDEFESPEPRSDLKDEPPRFRLVVDAVMKDE